MNRMLIAATLLFTACNKAQPAENDPLKLAAARPDANPIKPNYSAKGLSENSDAKTFCEILHTIPATKKASCKGSNHPGILVTNSCAETLTAALAGGKIKLEKQAIERCRAATEQTLSDCGFADKFGVPLPKECDGIIQGTLKAGDECRSALECEAGLQCAGVGPNDVGRCAPPAPPGSLCGTSVDALAVYTRQNSAEQTRPACDGYCDRNRCLRYLVAGEQCNADLQCGPGNSCQQGKCGSRS